MRLVDGILLFLVRAYRLGVSPMLPACCRFHPGCGEYAELSLRRHGWFKALFLIARRLSKCHPWHPGGFDPVPGTVPQVKGR